MEWTREKSLDLLDLYEQNPVLWNPKHGLYYNKVKKNDCWVKIAKVLGCPTEEVRKKTDSMLASFRRERAKGSRTIGTRKVYVSKWFAFKRMAFLMNRTKPKSRIAISTMDDVTLSDEELDAIFDQPDETDDSSHAPLKYEEIHYPEPAQVVVAPPPARVEKPPKRPRLESREEARAGEPREEPRYLEDALNMLRSAVVAPDASAVYGQHVANKLRDYTRRTKAIVQHHFNEILFHADMGQYDIDTGAPLPHPSYDPDPSPSTNTSPDINLNSDTDPNSNSNYESNKLRQRLQPELQFCH